MLTLDRSSATSLRGQVEDQLRDAVRSGRLRAGERLPSTRQLAGGLGLSRGIAQECYAQLIAEGYLTSRRGSATRVADRGGDAAGEVARPTATTPAPGGRALSVDFASGVPDLSAFPRDDWAWALREACRSVPTAALDYSDPQGLADLRQVLASYLRRVRAADVQPDHLVVCSGYAQGLRLLARVHAERGGRRLAFEDPGTRESAAAAAHAAGLEALPVPVDTDGIDVAALARSSADAVVVTPAHQWPTGVVMSPTRRLDLVAWARERSALVIEDDYDAEFRYDRDPVGLVQGLAPEQVAAVGTVSKSLSPALRLGWVACPPDLVAALVAEKEGVDRGCPTLDQLALARLVEAGRFDRHLRRMRALYASRRTVVVETLAEVAPSVRVSGLAAGFHAVLELASASEEEVVRRAGEAGVGLHGMAALRTESRGPEALVLGFGNLGERAIERGLRTVGPILEGR